MKFKAGDKVDWCGVKGLVIEDSFDTPYKIRVKFPFKNSAPHYYTFTATGKFYDFHTRTSLKLIGKRKKCLNQT